MGQSSNKGILKNNNEKKEEDLKNELNENYNNALKLKKVKEEDEKNELKKINQKWENEEKEKIIKEIDNKNLKGKKRKNSEENNATEVKPESDKNNSEDNSSNESEEKEQTSEEEDGEENEILESKLDEIKKKANSFLDDKMNDLIQKFKFAIDVNKYLAEEIEYIKKDSPKNLILPEKTVFIDNYIIKFLGYFGSELSLYKIKVLIEKEPSNEIIRDITFKMILSGLATQRAYKIKIQSSEHKKKFKENIQNWYNYSYKMKYKISADMKIDKKEIYFFNYDINNFEVIMIIHNQRLNGVENVLKSYNVKILTGNLLNNIILSPNMFLTKFCKNKSDWKTGMLFRGGYRYHPPFGWFGFALKLRNKFGEDNEWLGNKGKRGKEWCVAFHGIGRGDEFNKVLSILNNNLRVGPKQRYSNYINKRESTKKNFRYCGKGVYLTPDIKKAEHYAHKIKLGYFSKNIQFAVMARVDPDKIRDPGAVPINWILNGGNEEIRPYRLLVKMS